MDEFKKEITDSVSFRSEKIPLYLCSVIGFALDTIIPSVIRGISETIPYFVYGGRATAAYNRQLDKPSPLTADWDILFDDRVDEDIVPRFAEFMRQSLQESIRTHFKCIPEIEVTISNKEYVRTEQRGRYEVQIIDPYMPYRKAYDCIGISGCHDTGEDVYKNYCEGKVFQERQKINDIYYAGPSFIRAETVKVYEKDRLRKLRFDERTLREAIETKKQISRKFENDEEIDFEDLNAMETFEDIVDVYLSSYSKTKRTEQRLV